MTVYSPVVVAPSLVQNMPSVVYQTALQFQQTQQLQLPAASWAVHASEVNQIEPHLSIVKVGRTISDTVFAETIKTDSSSDQMSRKRQAKSRWDQKIPWKKLKAVIRENKMANSINGDEQKHMSENHSQKPEQNLDESYSGNDGGESLTTLQEDVGSCTERDGESRQYEVMNHEERINDSVCESCGSLSCDGSHGVSDHNEQEGNGSCESCGSLSCEGFHGIQQYHNAQGGNKTFCRKCGSYGHLDEEELKKDNVPESCKYCGYASAHDRTENEDAVLENSAGLTDLSQDNLLDEVKVNNNDSEEKNVLLTASKDAEPLNSRKARKILCWLTAEQKVHLLKAVCVRLRDAGVSGCLGVTELYTETET